MTREMCFKRLIKQLALLLAMSMTATIAAQAQTFAYVTNSASNAVTVIDTSSNAIVATIPVGLVPMGVAVAPNGGRVYVANRDSGSLSVIDPATNSVVATIPFVASAYSVAITPDSHRAYVTVGFGTVVAVDLTSNTVIATVPIVPAPENSPTSIGIAITPDGSKVYLTNQTNFLGQDVVSVIDTATNTLTGTVFIGASLPEGVAITPNGTRAYVSLGLFSVSAIDIATNNVTATIGVGFIPIGIAITPDGARGYVANLNDGTVSVLDLNANTVTSTVPVGPAPFAVAITPDGGKVFVSHVFQADTIVSVMDTATNSIISDIHLGFNTGPTAIAITPANKSAADLIADLLKLVSAMNLKNGITNSFDAKLQAVQASLAAAKANDQNTACNQLSAFINEVTAQSGNQLTVAQANQLLAQAAQIQKSIGCH